MQFNSKISRRGLLRAGAAGALASVAMPYVARAATESIKVGILLPFSGGLEVLGLQGFQAAEMALLEANEAGGVLGGRMFEIVKADDRTDPKTAVERTNELIRRDQVTAIIGPVTSANRDAMLPTIARYKTPLLYATDYEGGVCSPFVTCYSALPAHTVNPLVPFAVENLGKAFYLIGSDYIWPQKMNAAFREQAEKANAKIVAEEYAAWGAKDYGATLRKIESSGADVVVLTIVGADAITFVKQFTAAGLKDKIKIIFFGFSENYIAGLSTEESDGIVVPTTFISTLEKPEAKALVERVRKRYGADAMISATTDAHYTLTNFFIEGIRKAGSDEKDKILAAMSGLSLMSGNGEVQLRASDRHVDLNELIVVAKNGKLEVLEDLGRIVAPSQCG